MGTINPWRAISIGAVLGLALVGWHFWKLDRKIELAEEAMREAYDACSTRRASLYYDRKIKAEAAIRTAAGSFIGQASYDELAVHFENELRLRGCP